MAGRVEQAIATNASMPDASVAFLIGDLLLHELR
jgi:hypothetical protein